MASVSFYAKKFHGRKTASGSKYNHYAFTAAHRTLPFGTMLKLVNPATKAWTVVVVTDDGPHVRGRDLDISHAAAEQLGIVKDGVATVEMHRRTHALESKQPKSR